MTAWSKFSKSAKQIRQQVGLRRFLKLAQPYVATTIDQIDPEATQSSILVIAPHPDDEAIGCGGAIALHRKRGDAVHVVFTTDGGRAPKGHEKTDPETRKTEAARSLEILGGATQDFLELEDGAGQITKNVIKAISAAIETKKPDRIYVPWALDNHRDHKAAFNILEQALKNPAAETTVWQYEVWTPLVPNRYVPIASVLAQKEKAIRAHESQMQSHDYATAAIGLSHYRGLQAGIDTPCEAYFAMPADKLQIFSEL